MGLFTHVVVFNDLLPEKFKKYDGWQTKDVVESFMETLEITKDGSLLHITHKYEWVKDPERKIIGGYMKIVDTAVTKLEFHGDMNFYTWDDELKQPVDLIARFTEGRLTWIREKEKMDNGKSDEDYF